ncbi:hypothetical protein BUJ34_027075, partial [Salmonella enterica subsp. enterica serovar Muenchen]
CGVFVAAAPPGGNGCGKEMEAAGWRTALRVCRGDPAGRWLARRVRGDVLKEARKPAPMGD